MEWNDGGANLEAKGSKGSSSSSEGWTEERLREELDRTRPGFSGKMGAAIARLELVLSELVAQRSGDGVSPRIPEKEAGLDDAAERGRGIGLNSVAFAFRSCGEESGEDGKLAVSVCVAWAYGKTGDVLTD